ncbi:MAG: DUF445 domain-containing protein, partial [Mycobacterium sp.]
MVVHRANPAARPDAVRPPSRAGRTTSPASGWGPRGAGEYPQSLAESFVAADPQADAERRRGLRRMKVVAL